MRCSWILAPLVLLLAGCCCPSPCEQPDQTGTVLATFDKGGRYVISLGEDDGVKPGFRYIVSRGSNYIGTIQIYNVAAKQSAGSVLKAMCKDEIRRGDKVVRGQ